MKYLLFGGEDYYPCGGADDFIHGCDDKEELKAMGKESLSKHGGDWCHIFDLNAGCVISNLGSHKKGWVDVIEIATVDVSGAKGQEFTCAFPVIPGDIAESQRLTPDKQCSEIITVDITCEKEDILIQCSYGDYVVKGKGGDE